MNGNRQFLRRQTQIGMIQIHFLKGWKPKMPAKKIPKKVVKNEDQSYFNSLFQRNQIKLPFLLFHFFTSIINGFLYENPDQKNEDILISYVGAPIIQSQMNLFIFHRDLRLFDNTALIKQLRKFGTVTPIFIFPPQQIDPKVNKYFSSNSVQFMIQSLRELSDEIVSKGGQLYFFKGENLKVLEEIREKNKIRSIAYNLDYTPFAKKRDSQIEHWAHSHKIDLISAEDYGMYQHLSGQSVNPKSQKPYLVFTPFRNFCMGTLKVPKPDSFNSFSFQKNDNLDSLGFSFPIDRLSELYQSNPSLAVNGGRSHALKILGSLKDHKNYNKTRNTPSLPTTKLSAYLHFTTVSMREVYHAAVASLGLENNIINQIHWREFYLYITHHFPKVLEGKSFQQKFDQIKWKYSEKHWTAWKNGLTGFPIVDAAMRELNTSGYMHNRCRMIVASFLAKDLFLDWHEAERYFASKLVDYSPMQNSGGWQWTVGNGTDAAPYFRIFNPWTQQKDHDPECKYIKKWIPELREIPPQAIHKWQETSSHYRGKGVQYPVPIINHDKARKETLQTYNKYFKS